MKNGLLYTIIKLGNITVVDQNKRYVQTFERSMSRCQHYPYPSLLSVTLVTLLEAKQQTVTKLRSKMRHVPMHNAHIYIRYTDQRMGVILKLFETSRRFAKPLYIVSVLSGQFLVWYHYVTLICRLCTYA